MLLIMSASDALKRTRRIEVSGRDYTLAEYVGAAPKRGIYVEGNERNDNGLPQGFLVMQPPGAVTPAHFHEPNQFQVFVEGDARIGHRSATPLTVQYANGHTPYGPIVALDAGVTYFHTAPALGSRRQIPACVSGQAEQRQTAHPHAKWPQPCRLQ
jgi:hypothetical protein